MCNNRFTAYTQKILLYAVKSSVLIELPERVHKTVPVCVYVVLSYSRIKGEPWIFTVQLLSPRYIHWSTAKYNVVL